MKFSFSPELLDRLEKPQRGAGQIDKTFLSTIRFTCIMNAIDWIDWHDIITDDCSHQCRKCIFPHLWRPLCLYECASWSVVVMPLWFSHQIFTRAAIFRFVNIYHMSIANITWRRSGKSTHNQHQRLSLKTIFRKTSLCCDSGRSSDQMQMIVATGERRNEIEFLDFHYDFNFGKKRGEAAWMWLKLKLSRALVTYSLSIMSCMARTSKGYRDVINVRWLHVELWLFNYFLMPCVHFRQHCCIVCCILECLKTWNVKVCDRSIEVSISFTAPTLMQSSPCVVNCN